MVTKKVLGRIKSDIHSRPTIPQRRAVKDVQICQQSNFCEQCTVRVNLARTTNQPVFETSLCEECVKRIIQNTVNRKESLPNNGSTRYSVIDRSARIKKTNR